MPKIDQQSQLIFGGIQIVYYLCPMFVTKLGYRFYLNDDFIITNEIGNILLIENFSSVG